MKTLDLIFFILCVIASILMIVWKLYKLQILTFISRWEWGAKIVKQQYFNTLFNREKNRVRSVKRAVKLAKMKHSAENLKQYVIEVEKGLFWYGTRNEWTAVQKNNPKLRGKWPLSNAVFQTGERDNNKLNKI